MTIQFQKRIFIGIIILFILISLWTELQQYKQLYHIFKPLTTFLILASTAYLGNTKVAFLQYCLFALVFCLIGDTLLLYDNYFVFGLISFLIGHILFIISFLKKEPWTMFKIPMVILLLIAVVYYTLLFPDLEWLRIPVLIYILVIITMSWQGIGLYFVNPGNNHLLVAIGAVLFLVSDAVLAWNKFKQPISYAGTVILSTYWSSVLFLSVGLLNESRKVIASLETD